MLANSVVKTSWVWIRTIAILWQDKHTASKLGFIKQTYGKRWNHDSEAWICCKCTYKRCDVDKTQSTSFPN